MAGSHTFKPFVILAIALGILAAIVGGIHFSQRQAAAGAQFTPPPAAIELATVENQIWSSTLTALGTVYSDEGITVAAEVAGRVESIHFLSGDTVEAGALLVTQDSGNERAQLEAANARLTLAQATFKRTDQLRKNGTVSLSQYDQAQQELLSARAEVQNLSSTLEKKTIVAPFRGRLGIRRVDQGQDLLVGDHIVELQAHDKLKVNFNLPQRFFSQLQTGLDVEVNLIETKEPTIKGKVNAIGAAVNETTRSIELQASLENADGILVPGMAVDVRIALADTSEQLVIPATAVVYAPYGDTVFVIEKDENDQMKARQQFIKIAARRGDFVAVAAGLNEGERVATSGAFKLYNGQSVMPSPREAVSYSLDPQPADG